MLSRRFRRGKGRLGGFGNGSSFGGEVRLGGGKVKENFRAFKKGFK